MSLRFSGDINADQCQAPCHRAKHTFVSDNNFSMSIKGHYSVDILPEEVNFIALKTG